jgi:hypothetical protein
MADALKMSDIEKMLGEFVNLLEEIHCAHSIESIYFWHAEIQILKKMRDEFGFDIGNILTAYEWIDLCKIFRSTPIVIRDCFNYKLKTIWKYMKQHDLIATECPPDECGNGLESVEIASKYYASHREFWKEKLIAYNGFDCRVMYDILECVVGRITPNER